MKNIENKVAFITGAASGIGFEIAMSMAHNKVNLMLSDKCEEKLKTAKEKILDQNKSKNLHIDYVVCDVSDYNQMHQAANYTLEIFKKIHILVNNAGVSFTGRPGEIPIDDWHWIVNINLMGVVYGVELFLPIIKSHNEGGHIVNTASMAGHWARKNMGPYNTTKFAVVGYSESLRADLKEEKIGVSVLCPGWVSTNIVNSDMNRPSGFKKSSWTEEEKLFLRNSLDPKAIGSLVIDSIKKDRMYIFSHPDMQQAILARSSYIDKDYTACMKHPSIDKN